MKEHGFSRVYVHQISVATNVLTCPNAIDASISIHFTTAWIQTCQPRLPSKNKPCDLPRAMPVVAYGTSSDLNCSDVDVRKECFKLNAWQSYDVRVMSSDQVLYYLNRSISPCTTHKVGIHPFYNGGCGSITSGKWTVQDHCGLVAPQ